MTYAFYFQDSLVLPIIVMTTLEPSCGKQLLFMRVSTLAHLSAFTMLWRNAVSQSVNYPISILSQRDIYVFMNCYVRHCSCQISFLKIKKRKSFQTLYRLQVCETVAGQNKFQPQIQIRNLHLQIKSQILILY